MISFHPIIVAPEKDYYSIDELSAKLGIGRDVITEAVNRKYDTLPWLPVGKHRKIHIDRARDYFKAHEVGVY